MLEFVKNLLGGSNASVLRKLEKTVKQVDDLEEKYKQLTDEELRAKTDEFRERRGLCDRP